MVRTAITIGIDFSSAGGNFMQHVGNKKYSQDRIHGLRVFLRLAFGFWEGY
jgi:hypothetical protein